jgi:hypothetical protein
MNLQELSEIIKYVRKESSCPKCKRKYNFQDISIIASTKFECLLELRCQYCKTSVLSDIVATPKNKVDTRNVPLISHIMRENITDNDILDVKNFLNNFDGDFKKLFQ